MSEPALHPLKLAEAFQINADQMQGVELPSPEGQECLLAFRENMKLVKGLIATPGWAMVINQQWAEACTVATMCVIKDRSIESATSDELKLIIPKAQKRMAKVVERDNKNLDHRLEMSTEMLEQHIMCCGPFIHGMFEGILKSLCIQAWTAIEVLIEDLHVKCIEKNPGFFGSEVLEKHERTKAKLKGQKFSFRSRDKFRDAYKVAFESDPTINDILLSSELAAIVVVRNLLVHKGGVVDLIFLDDDMREAPQLKNHLNPQLNTRIKMDGTSTRAIIDGAVSKAYELLRAVDRWMMAKFLATLPK